MSSSPPELQEFLGKRFYKEPERVPDIGLPKNKLRDFFFRVVSSRKCLWLAFLLAVALLFGALWPDRLNFENFRKIEIGTTENDAERIFGEPARASSVWIVYDEITGVPLREERGLFKHWIGGRFKVRLEKGIVIDKWETTRLNSSYFFRKLGHFLIGVAIGITFSVAVRIGSGITGFVKEVRRRRQ